MKMFIKSFKYLIIVSVILLAAGVSNAGDRSKYGTSAAPELLIPVGSRGTSLGGSIISSLTGVESMFWNPAGLSIMNSRTELMVSHLRYIADINLNYVAGAVDLGNIGVIGASLKTMDFGEELRTTLESPDGTGETWSPTYIITSVSYARRMSDKILFGATFKLIYEQVINTKAYGFGTDFGLQYIAGESGIKFGVALKNFGPSMKFDGSDLDAYYQPFGTPGGTSNEPRRITLQDYPLPTTLELGLSYNLTAGKRNNVEFSTTFQNNNYSSDEYRMGIEYVYNKMLFLRAAYTYYPDYKKGDNIDLEDQTIFGPTFGIGFNYPVGNIRFGLDYAYRITKKFSANQWFSLLVGF